MISNDDKIVKKYKISKKTKPIEIDTSILLCNLVNKCNVNSLCNITNKCRINSA